MVRVRIVLGVLLIKGGETVNLEGGVSPSGGPTLCLFIGIGVVALAGRVTGGRNRRIC